MTLSARWAFPALLLGATLAPSAANAQQLALPRRPGSVRFAVIGDMETGDKFAYDVGKPVWRWYQKFPFTFVILLGDNIYGSERPQDFERKFTTPYQALLDAKVQFYATLGNHDDPNQRFFKPYNMGGERYLTFKKGNVRFFVLDSNDLDPDQVKWLDQELAAAGSGWKIAYFHHAIYTTGRRGPNRELWKVLEPLFVKYGVDVVFSGHEHSYERFIPQGGIYYFTAGASAKLNRGNTRPGPTTAKTFDSDRPSCWSKSSAMLSISRPSPPGAKRWTGERSASSPRSRSRRPWGRLRRQDPEPGTVAASSLAAGQGGG